MGLSYSETSMIAMLIVMIICQAQGQKQPSETVAIYEPQFDHMSEQLKILNDTMIQNSNTFIDRMDALQNFLAQHFEVQNETFYNLQAMFNASLFDHFYHQNLTFMWQMERIKIQTARNANKLQVISDQLTDTNLYMQTLNESSYAANAKLTEIQISSSDTADELKETGPIVNAINKVNTAVDTISTTVDSINTIIDAIQLWTEGSQYSEEQAQTQLLTTISEELSAGAFNRKVREAIALERWMVKAPTTQAIQVDLDMCEYDPFGIGFINCNGMEVEFMQMETVEIFAIPIPENNITDTN